MWQSLSCSGEAEVVRNLGNTYTSQCYNIGLGLLETDDRFGRICFGSGRGRICGCERVTRLRVFIGGRRKPVSKDTPISFIFARLQVQDMPETKLDTIQIGRAHV